MTSRNTDSGNHHGWFADLSDEDVRDARHPWQPFVQLDGMCLPLPIWFATEADCEGWIRDELPKLGQIYGALDA